jgi:Protein of unknown function (DUF2877)
MRVTAEAIGSAIELRKPRSGWVHSVFTHAVNLQLGDELWTVVPCRGHDAALTVRLTAVVMPGDMGLRAGDPVWVRSGYVRAGQAVIDARTAARWVPRAYHADLRGLGMRAAELEAAARHVAWAGSWPLAEAVAAALASGSGGDLDDAVRQAAGRGPGLTPAGDDVLAGVLAVLTSPVVAAGCEPVTARLRAALAAALPTTTDISRAMLRQASHGHVSRPVWELTRALLSDGPAAAAARARADVLAIGATSGGDTCAGLAAACRLLSCSLEWTNA